MANLAHWDGNRYSHIALFSVSLTNWPVGSICHIVSSFILMNDCAWCRVLSLGSDPSVQGPGGVRREELEQKNEANEAYNSLRRVVYFLFDSDMDTMAANKREIFQTSKRIWTICSGHFPWLLPAAERPRQKNGFTRWYLPTSSMLSNIAIFTTWFLKSSTVRWSLHLGKRLAKLHRRCLATESQYREMAIRLGRFNNLHLHIRRRRAQPV